MDFSAYEFLKSMEAVFPGDIPVMRSIGLDWEHSMGKGFLKTLSPALNLIVFFKYSMDPAN